MPEDDARVGEAVERGMFSSDESGVDALECGGEVVCGGVG